MSHSKTRCLVLLALAQLGAAQLNGTQVNGTKPSASEAQTAELDGTQLDITQVNATQQTGAQPNGAYSVATSEDLSLKLSSVDAPQPGTSASQQWRLHVDDQAGQRQVIDGFGAAWTDATVQVFDELPSDQQQQVMEDLFGESGLKLSLMRHTIGQSDLTPASIGRWSYDENNGQPDTSLSAFDLTLVGSKMVDWLLRMQALRPDVTLLGSPWSPPEWMKATDFNTLQSQYVDAWAEYMVKYLEAFRARGVTVHAVTMQNEPLHNGDSAWTTYIDQSYAALLASKLKPAMKASGLSTEIWAYDHNTDQPGYPQYVLDNAGEHVDAVAWHCYSPQAGWSPLTDLRNQRPNVRQYMTECWTHLQNENFFELPDFVTGPMQNYASGAMAWTLGGSTNYDVAYPGGCGPCSGVVQVDRQQKTYEKTKDFYTLGQFSKYVQKGARYLSNTGSYTYPDGTGVQATSFQNPGGSRVVVIVNKIHNSLMMEIGFSSGDTWHANVPGRAVTTWVLPPKAEFDTIVI